GVMDDDRSLARALDRLADRGDVRGADEVFAAASMRRASRRPMVVLAAAAVVAVLAVGANVVWFADDAVDRTPDQIVAGNGVAEIPLTSATIFQPVVSDGSAFVAIDDDERAVVSTDGGATWTVAELPGQTAPRRAIQVAHRGDQIAIVVEVETTEMSSGAGSLTEAAWVLEGATWRPVGVGTLIRQDHGCEGTLGLLGLGRSIAVADCERLTVDGETVAVAPRGHTLGAPLAWGEELRVPVAGDDGMVVSFLTVVR
ncbi:MAG TPA: hypothetical protein VEA78_10570, partial [Acidimicrobiales bacterium]|nr:hypothetical protein [Acidimicrobiales bacterium]